MDLKQIISYLTILELPYDKPLYKENVTTQYRQLAQIYHPDTANPRYKDGEKFKELRKAYDFVIENIDEINKELGFDNVETGEPKSVEVSQYNNNVDVSVVNERTSRRHVFIAIGIVLGVFAIIGLIVGIVEGTKCKHSNMYIYKTTASCEVSGYDYYKCKDCGYEKQLYKSASGHNWLEKSNIEATCTTDGKITYECNNCHQTKYTTSNALGHSISNSFTCSRCHKDVYKILLNDTYPKTVEDYYNYEYLQERNQRFLMSKVTINKVTYSYSSFYNSFSLTFNGTVDYRYKHVSGYYEGRFRFRLIDKDGDVFIDTILSIPDNVYAGDPFTITWKNSGSFYPSRVCDMTLYILDSNRSELT